MKRQAKRCMTWMFQPHIQEWTSWILLVGALLGWPITALTVAKDEPPFVLGLSWLALILTSYNNLLTVYQKPK